ncbi:MAG: TolC family protein [Elusimicrobiota bacterium]
MIPLLLALLAAPAAAEPPLFRETLAQAETEVRAHSLELKAAAERSAAARDRAGASFAPLLPRLTLDGSYRYQTEVPLIALVPGQPARPFGDHRATSIGPTLTWTLWDEGSFYKSWRAQQSRAKSQEETERLLATQATLGARLAYIQVQLAREQVRLLADAAGLADAEYRDIEKRLKAGAASRIDLLSGHQDALSRRKEFLQAQAELGGSLRELLQLAGRTEPLDLSRPIDERASTSTPSGLLEPTLRVSLDDPAETAPALAAAENAKPDAAHPLVMIRRRDAETARLGAESAAAAGGPKIQFTAGAAYQYPNGPVLESVTQKTVGLTASVPLFEMGQNARLADEQTRLAGAADREGDLAAEELARDWDKARVALSSLRAQSALDEKSVAETAELARLVYSAYRAGTSNYLEVQSANLRALQAKTSAARTRAEILIQLATLAQLAVQG